jgi:hypothetical protein
MADAERKTRGGSEVRQRQHRITFRVAAHEYSEIEAKAERIGVSLGAFIRVSVLEAPTTRAVRRPPVEKAALAQLLGQIGRVGGNLHQIARHLNFGNVEAAADLPEALEDLRAMKAVLMRALGRDAA